MVTKQIALYGRGGVGTSTTTANLSAALAEAGHRVMQVGFDARHNSTGTLRGGVEVTTLLEARQAKGAARNGKVAVVGFKGVLCIETGFPAAGEGCNCCGLSSVMTFLEEQKIIEKYRPDIILYDVSGEAVCGGIAVALLTSIAERVYVVCSSDFTSLFAANTIFRIASEAGSGGEGRLQGIIANGMSDAFAESMVADFAAKTETPVVGCVPRSLVAMQSDLYGQTVIEAAPLSNLAYIYRRLARQIIVELKGTIAPRALTTGELKGWAREWGDRIVELENGVIRDGAAI